MRIEREDGEAIGSIGAEETRSETSKHILSLSNYSEEDRFDQFRQMNVGDGHGPSVAVGVNDDLVSGLYGFLRHEIVADDGAEPDRVKLERRQLAISGARLDQFKRGEISLKKVVDDGYVLVGALTILPLSWKDTVMELLGDLDVSLGLSSDSRGEGLGPKDVAIAETIWSLDKVVKEGKRRLELLNGPLSRFAFDDPLTTWEEVVARYPPGSEVAGTITRVMPWGAEVDLDLPFIGVVRAFKFDVASLHVGDVLPFIAQESWSTRLRLQLKYSESDRHGPFPLDVLRVEVHFDDSQVPTRREVLIFVNDEEMTSKGAGRGVSPSHLFEPTNRLRVAEAPTTVVLACCTCGIEGCGSTDVRIEGDESFVYWDWQKDLPTGRRMVFDRVAYDVALDAVDADLSWISASRNVAGIRIGTTA